MIVSADGTSGYLASDRKPTKGKDDLYRWTSPQYNFLHTSNPFPNRQQKEILVLDEDGNVPLDNTHVWLIPMNQEGPSQYKDHFTTELVPKEDKEGAFYLRWSVTDTLSTETADADIRSEMERSILDPDEKTTYILVAQHEGYPALY